MDFGELRRELPAVQDRVYLNTGTSGPMPVSAAEAETELLNLLVREGFSSPPAAKAYLATLEAVREALAELVGADVDDLALMHSTSEGVGVVASGLSWREGDEVIISDLEHVSGIAPWLYLAQTRGVKVVNLESQGGYLGAEAIKDALTDRTRLLCISHVSYATGAVLPVAEVCRAAKEVGALVLVDGAQAAGQLPLDMSRLGCDFYALPGQKWLLGAEGTGALYVAKSAIDQIKPTRIGWASLEDEDPTAPTCRLSPNARRFESGTIHAPAFAALERSIRLLAAYGWENVRERAKALAGMARQRLSAVDGVRILTPQHAASGLLTFSVAGVDPDRVVKFVWSRHRVVIRSIPHPSALRASFHVFNTEEDVEKLALALQDAIRG